MHPDAYFWFGSNSDGSCRRAMARLQDYNRCCRHGRRASQCRECRGSAFCTHGKRKARCSACGGSTICFKHNRKDKYKCAQCKTEKIEHWFRCSGGGVDGVGGGAAEVNPLLLLASVSN